MPHDPNNRVHISEHISLNISQSIAWNTKAIIGKTKQWDLICIVSSDCCLQTTQRDFLNISGLSAVYWPRTTNLHDVNTRITILKVTATALFKYAQVNIKLHIVPVHSPLAGIEMKWKPIEYLWQATTQCLCSDLCWAQVRYILLSSEI